MSMLKKKAGIYRLVVVAGIFLFSTVAHSQHTWKKKASGTGADLRSIIYANNQFLAVGDSGTILTSADGSTWVHRTSGTARRLNALVYGGGKYVAVGDSGAIISSIDGVTWTGVTGLPVNVLSITYGLGQYIVTSSTGVIYVSPDAEQWEPIFLNFILRSIAFGNGQFVGVGGPYRSSTLTDWTKIDLHAVGEFVAFSDSLFMMEAEKMNEPLTNVNYDILCYTSYDGIQWINLSLNGGFNTKRSISFYSGVHVNSNPALSVLVGEADWEAMVWVIEQNKRTTDTTRIGGPILRFITYANGKFVAVGDSGTILTSPLDSHYTAVREHRPAEVVPNQAFSFANNTLMPLLPAAKNASPVLVRVFTPAGRMVLSSQARTQDGRASVSVEHLCAGMYYATATCGSNIAKVSFVKNK